MTSLKMLTGYAWPSSVTTDSGVRERSRLVSPVSSRCDTKSHVAQLPDPTTKRREISPLVSVSPAGWPLADHGSSVTAVVGDCTSQSVYAADDVGVGRSSSAPAMRAAVTPVRGIIARDGQG